MKSLIRKLVEAYGPSGSEEQIREIIRAEIRSYPDYITVDPLGNLIGVIRKKSKSGKKIMLSAHMDEIGLIVSHVDDKGFARFQTVGGVSPLTCIGGRVRFANGLTGVIGVDIRRDEPDKVPAIGDLFIDTGASSRAECPVKIGDAAGFDRPMEELGDRLVAKSMDDRIGVAVLIETLRLLKSTPHEVSFVFSVQEEVGLRGATTAAFGVDAEVGLAVDVTGTGDTPNGRKMDVALGGGAAIKLRDARLLTDPRVKELLLQRAQSARIPVQLEILEGGTTDASAMQVARGGMAAGCISIPTRYIHTPSEMVDLRDVQAAVHLLVDVLQKPIDF